MAAKVEIAELDMPGLPSTDTLFGDLRDAVLDRLRAMPKPWTVMSEDEQREMIEGVERVSRHLVHSAVLLIAANGRASIPVTVEKCTAKDGIQVVLQASRQDPLRFELLDAVGRSALLIVADSEAYMGEKTAAKPDPAQPALPGTAGEPGEVKPFRGRNKDPE